MQARRQPARDEGFTSVAESRQAHEEFWRQEILPDVPGARLLVTASGVTGMPPLLSCEARSLSIAHEMLVPGQEQEHRSGSFRGRIPTRQG